MNCLNCLGIGVVASNKNTDTKEIMVYLPKETPSQDGEITSTTEQQTVTNSSSTGDSKSSNVLISNTVPAIWASFNSNRVTSPDVRVGSKVAVYQWTGSNSYYWTTYGVDKASRLETVVWAFSASPNINENTPITSDNYYIVTLSTHKKKIEILTGQGNGEPLGYQVTFNLAEGWWGSMDSNKNIFLVNGVDRSFTYTNQDKSTLTVNKKDFTLINEGKSLIQSKESITLKTKKMTTIADESFDLATKTMGIKSNTCNWSASSGFKLTGNSNQTGTYKSTGTVTSDSDCISAGISGKSHKHGNVKFGGDKTSVPVGV